MNKQKFLDKMRQALTGQVSSKIMSENINFYSDYIDSEILSGKKESEVLDLLGDPRLLAKTIIDLGGSGSENSQRKEQDNSKESNGDAYYNNNTSHMENDNRNRFKGNSFIGLKGCLINLAVLFIFFVILKLVLSIAIFLAVPLCILFIIIVLIKRFRY